MQNDETTNTPLFGTIGAGAEEIDNLDNDDGHTQKLVDEIESMCINCEENVWATRFVANSGHDSTSVDKDPLLPRGHFNVILMSTLWYYTFPTILTP
jgi:hypothetical protein